MLKIGVVGSRSFRDYAYLCEILDSFYSFLGIFIVISGGADGADLLATRWANERHMPTPIVYPADWHDLSHPSALIKVDKDGRKYDVLAGFRRNQKIVDEVDMLVAFMNPVRPTPGTTECIQCAKEKGIPIYIYRPGKGVFTFYQKEVPSYEDDTTFCQPDLLNHEPFPNLYYLNKYIFL